MHHQPLGVERLGRGRALGGKVQFAIHVVLDQRHLVAREQGHQFALFLLGHQAAQRVLKAGHEPAGFDRVARQGLGQCGQIDAFARMGRHLHGLQVQPFQRLQRGVEGGGFDHHDVAGPGHGLQAQVERLHGAVGDDDLGQLHGGAVQAVAQRDLLAQALVARRQALHDAPGVKPSHAARQAARQPLEREQLQPGKRRAQRHQVAVARRAQHLEHQVADGHAGGAAGRLRGQGLGRALRLGGRWKPHAHVVARARARVDQALGLQQVVGLEHGGRADAPGAAGLAHRGHAVARAQRTAVDELGNRVGVAFVAFHGSWVGSAAN